MYGSLNDVNVFSGYISCKDGSYIGVLGGVFSDVAPQKHSDGSGFLGMIVTRRCFSIEKNSTFIRHYVLSYDKRNRRYGDPDGDPRLLKACGNYEQSLPGLAG